MPIEKIIVVEDELGVRKSLEQQLRGRRYDVAAVATLAEARAYLAKDNFDLMFLDVHLPDGMGTELLKTLQQRPERPLVVMTTGFGSIESAVDCMKNGAFDYIIKPFSFDHILITLKKAAEFTQLVKVNRFLSGEEDESSGYEMLGRTAAMEKLRQLVRKVARTQATVLVQGESGTGKELVARMLYKASPRVDAPFIKLNCAAIPENLIESELFGHEKGAFTGALNKREGRFELAHGGTILLDEISEISPAIQAKLLRVLQEREFERVGGNRTIKVDVRVIATTNRNLEESVERKEFRQDLFFRLNVVPIHVPPLRDRREDIAYLAQQFVQRYIRKHGVHVHGFSDAAIAALSAHSWSGNVRELQNVVERAVILGGDGDLIEPEHLGLTPMTASTGPLVPALPAMLAQPATPAGSVSEEGLLVPNGGSTLAEFERRHILATLERCHGNRTHTARLLGISIRTIRNKLNEYNGADGIPAIDDQPLAALGEKFSGS